MNSLTKKLIPKLFGVSVLLSLLGIIVGISFVPISTSKSVDTPFLAQVTSQKALVFFGFETCSDVCPASMALLREVVKQYREGNQSVQVVFIDIDKDSTAERANHFAKQYHDSFIGFKPNDAELQSLQNTFGLNIKQSGTTIQHVGRTYLLDKQQTGWKLVKTFNPNTMNPQQLVAALTTMG